MPDHETTVDAPLAEGWRRSSSPPCRLCERPLETTFVDLGMSPLCESYVPRERADAMEPFFPLNVRVCEECLLVQLPEYVAPEDIFSDYAYLSSFSDSWVAHARRFAEEMIDDLSLDSSSRVVEVASNDGYLLQHFVARGVPVLGIEPAANVAAVAQERGVESLVRFLGEDTGREAAGLVGRADLVVANNVLAHVPDLVDFVAGLRELLAEDGVLSLEFPHLLRLIEGNQFDTIYHEHYSYLTLLTASRALATGGLEVVDVRELATHGGSLRVLAAHAGRREATGRVADVLEAEAAAGLHTLEGHLGFRSRVEQTKHDLVRMLIDLRRQGARVAGYGAPGKGNTLLNFCGIRTDLIEYTVDRNPLKQGKLLPGTRIPIHPPERLDEDRPDVIVILPWNLRDEIIAQLEHARSWGARFLVPIPVPELVGP